MIKGTSVERIVNLSRGVANLCFTVLMAQTREPHVLQAFIHVDLMVRPEDWDECNPTHTTIESSVASQRPCPVSKQSYGIDVIQRSSSHDELTYQHWTFLLVVRTHSKPEIMLDTLSQIKVGQRQTWRSVLNPPVCVPHMTELTAILNIKQSLDIIHDEGHPSNSSFYICLVQSGPRDVCRSGCVQERGSISPSIRISEELNISSGLLPCVDGGGRTESPLSTMLAHPQRPTPSRKRPNSIA